MSPRPRSGHDKQMIWDKYISTLASSEGVAVLEKYNINTPLRTAAFLAQCASETGGFTLTTESLYYTTSSRIASVWPSRFTARSAIPFARNERKLANSVYGGRMGNERNGTNDDDGFRYRGRGFLQTTGYDNYKMIGDAIGVDLAGDPDLLESPDISLLAAAHEFSKFLKYCDMGERGWRAVCNGINRGNALSKFDPIGWSDRQIWYQRCCDALGITGKTEDDLLRLGDQGPLVKAIQERLAALGYAVGRPDGIFGSRTRAAVLAFQAENKLDIDGLIGPQTREALNAETAVPMPLGERATETAADLREAGSETMATAKAIKDTAGAGGALTAAVGAAKAAAPADPPADLIVTTKEIATEISSWQSITKLIGETFSWATSHWWIFAIVFCFIVYRWGGRIEWNRLKDHRLGFNLSR